jgi:hypothetical protein
LAIFHKILDHAVSCPSGPFELDDHHYAQRRHFPYAAGSRRQVFP